MGRKWQSYHLPLPGRSIMFLFIVTSRPALGATQRPIKWVPRALSPRVKLKKHETDHFHLVSKYNRYYCYLCGLFNGDVNSSDYLASNNRLIIELERIWKEAVVD
jgi:hypothetical protein